MMGWTYMITCIFDFIVAPILWSLLQAYTGGVVTLQWQPLTLQGAGLYHVAMGAVLGIAAYGRTREKLNSVAGEHGDEPIQTNMPSNAGTTYIPPSNDSYTSVDIRTGPGYTAPVPRYRETNYYGPTTQVNDYNYTFERVSPDPTARGPRGLPQFRG